MTKTPPPPPTPSSKSDMDPLHQANARASAAQIAYFRAIPWCAAHLQSTPSQPLTITQSVSRALKPPASTLDTLLSRTLNTPDAIPAYITFYATPSDPKEMVDEVKAFVALGSMVNGWEGICHGGMVVTLLDEVMGQVFAVNKERGVLDAKRGVMTGWLNTRFEKPVFTGTNGGKDGKGVVLVTARLVRREGRKFWLEGVVSGEGGVVLARGESLFVMLREKL